jgi:hypothetical protein
MKHTKLIKTAAAAVAVATFAMAAPAFADTTETGTTNAQGYQMRERSGEGRGPQDGTMRSGVVGTISSVNGTTLVVAGKQGFIKDSATDVSYTVDASHAVIKKDRATSTFSALIVGETVMVRGTVTGTNVVATDIDTGMKFKGGMGGPGRGEGAGRDSMGSSTPIINGNGQPVIAGSISAVNGSTLTVSTKSGLTYTVDVSNAKIVSGKDTVAISALTTGEQVIVQGAVNGTNVAASSVIAEKNTHASATGDANKAPQGFFRGIGHFFAGLFGF